MLTARPLRVGVLCSGRAPGLLGLLESDPRRGAEYVIACCVTSEDTFAERAAVEDRGVPCVPHPISRFCRDRGARRGDMDIRAEYDRATLGILAEHGPDLLVLDGYLLLVTRPLLAAFGGRIINVHHSDLAQRNDDGRARYPGLRAVRDAFFAGERETRASAHVVTGTLDDGPVLLRSWAFPVPPVAAWARAQGERDVLKAAAWAHQEWMLRAAWGPMLAGAIEIASLAMAAPRGRLALETVGTSELRPDGSFAPSGRLLETA